MTRTRPQDLKGGDIIRLSNRSMEVFDTSPGPRGQTIVRVIDRGEVRGLVVSNKIRLSREN